MKIPTWACNRYGGYEHDWLDCFDCQQNYEAYQDSQLCMKETEQSPFTNEEGS